MKFDIFLATKLSNLFHKYIQWREDRGNKKWENLFKESAFIEIPLQKSIKIRLYKDSILSKLIYEGFENEEQQFVSKFLRPSDIFFDVGANIGLFSLIAASKVEKLGHSYAFEPSKITFNRLNENIELNDMSDIITPTQIGISDSVGKLTLNESNNGYDAWNTFAATDKHKLSLSKKVDITTLEQFIHENKIQINKIALIKIDVEGWELMVLKGLNELINDNNFTPCFLIEFAEENSFRAGYSSRDIYKYLVDRNYKWFKYNAATNTIEETNLKAYYPYENLIAVKSDNLSNVKARLL